MQPTRDQILFYFVGGRAWGGVFQFKIQCIVSCKIQEVSLTSFVSAVLVCFPLGMLFSLIQGKSS